MRFRTEIEPINPKFPITHADRFLLFGSCFSDNVGERLKRDGFDVCVNPFGPLYNPATLARFVETLVTGRKYKTDDFYQSSDGVYHCLDFAMRYQNEDASLLAGIINAQLYDVKNIFDKATVLCLTFGSAEAFMLKEPKQVVGNCHKLSDFLFERVSMTPTDIVELWLPILEELNRRDVRVIATVSPIRHLAYGLHGNQLGKARLLLALDELSDKLTYFPAYEILLDDLRDYRYYDADMKHPSEVACDYIYEKFSTTFFTRQTLKLAAECRSAALKAAHRPLI